MYEKTNSKVFNFSFFILSFIERNKFYFIMNNTTYSRELQNILSYMSDILAVEFPTDVFTPEYLILAILDNKKCHATGLLDNYLMSNTLEQLKNLYTDFLRNHSNGVRMKQNKDIAYNTELKTIFDNAELEKERLNAATLASEHLLLSMLNPKNQLIKLQEIFKNVGVDYNFVINKCTTQLETTQKPKELKKMGQGLNKGIIPIKTDGGVKIFTKSDNNNSFIKQFTTSINQLAKEGKIDKLVGREDILKQIVKVLARRNKNNVVLVGNGGSGKTAIINGIADLIERGEVPQILQDKEIVMLNITAMISGTHFRGMFEERVNGLFNELKNNPKYILFIDDMHTVLKSSNKERDTDISPMIGQILSEGDVRVIGTTTFKNYRNSIESNSSISRKLQKIVVEPTTISETINILNNNKKYYEEFHNVKYSDAVIEQCVKLSERYISDRSLPDSAIDVLDLSGAHTSLLVREPQNIIDARKRMNELLRLKNEAANNGEFELVDSLNEEENRLKSILADFKRDYAKNKDQYSIDITIDDITTAISDMTNIPIQKLNVNEKTRIANIDKTLKGSVIGQDEAVNTVCQVVKRNKVGLGKSNKTQAVLLFLGPSGVGKTFLAKKLAAEVFGDENAIVRLDMSEYSEKNSVSKLIGASAGYVGYEEGGQLTEAIKNKPHCVLLLDEIEKADNEVYNIFLQLFDEGRLTDNSGQLVSFKNVIVIMTSNVGVKQAQEIGKGVGFSQDSDISQKAIIEKQLKYKFAPEFLNRIDKIVYFNSLSNDDLKSIVLLECDNFKKRLNEINLNINFDETIINYIHSLAIEQKEYGARPIMRIIQDNIEDKVTGLLLENEYDNNYTFNVKYENEYVTIN